jgi:regulatory protein
VAPRRAAGSGAKELDADPREWREGAPPQRAGGSRARELDDADVSEWRGAAPSRHAAGSGVRELEETDASAWREDAPPRRAALSPAEEFDDALARCYRHLGEREHSAAELRRKLERARLGGEAVDAAIATVTQQGHLDDARYARLLAEDRRNIDGWGVDRIRARLQAAGIERDLIDSVLAGHDAASELVAAGALLRRRCRGGLRDDRERQRAFAILIRAGYDSTVAYDAIRSVGGEAWGEGPPDP